MSTDELDVIDHVAVVVDDIEATLQWYTAHFKCRCVYKDSSWAMIEFRNTKLALVTKQQHPQHFAILHHDPALFAPVEQHRDGSESCYISDPAGNQLELIQYK